MLLSFKPVSARIIAQGTLLFCVFLLSFAFVLEYFVELTPCPLCIAQRIFFFLVGLVGAAFLWFPKWVPQRLAALKIMIFSLLGGAIAARQVWMQWHPHQVESDGCAVLFGNFIQNFLQALGGTGNCATVDWTLIGLSIAEWSLLSFLFLMTVGGWLFLATFRQKEEASHSTSV